MTAPRPSRARLLLRLAALGVAALVVATLAALLAQPAKAHVPASLAFSAAILVAAWASRHTLRGDERDRAVSLGAAASVGAAPFIAFCCDQALTVPTWDSRPLEGLGPFMVAAFALFLLAVGPLVAFVAAIPLALWANHETRAFMRFLAGLGVAAALAFTIPAAARRAHFPDPDGYVPSLPVLAQIDGAACPSARCVRCPAGSGFRPFTLVSPEGERELGSIEATCDKLVFRHDPARNWVLVSGDPDHGATLHAWEEVGVYEEARPGRSARHLSELRDRLAPPLGWIIEAALGVLIAIGSLLYGLRRHRSDAPQGEIDARATAHASMAFAAAVLFTTPLATAWYAGLVVPLR